jgi:predicted amino acid-binding ACT domain protein
MADQIRRVDYSYVEVADRPGEAARVFAALRDQGVSLLSTTAFPTGKGFAQIDLVASQGDLEKAAAKAGLKLSPKKHAFYISGPDRPGAAAEIFAKLAERKINVTAATATCAQSGFGMILWVKPGDFDAAAKALGV